MSLFETSEVEFNTALFAVFFALIVVFAWKSTYVCNYQPRTILVVHNRRRLRNILLNRLNPGITTTSSSYRITEGLGSNSSQNSGNINTPSEALQSILGELTRGRQTIEAIQNAFNNLTYASDLGERQILNIMDSENNMENLRHRPNAGVFQTTEPSSSTIDTSIVATSREGLNYENAENNDNDHAENCSNENNENENKSNPSESIPSESNEILERNTQYGPEFRIKIKYLNDDLKLVTGSPNEPIGNFKKRYFSMELEAQKLVRLVFNGQVLQPDTKTLTDCGLFDNCVIHCVIHTAINNDLNNRGQNNNQADENRNGIALNFFNLWNVNNVALVLRCAVMLTLSLTLLCCWYCRINYGELFTLYSTVGLFFITIIYFALFPLILSIE